MLRHVHKQLQFRHFVRVGEIRFRHELFVSVLHGGKLRFCALFFAPFQIAKIGGALRGILTALEEESTFVFVVNDLKPNSPNFSL